MSLARELDFNIPAANTAVSKDCSGFIHFNTSVKMGSNLKEQV